MTQLDLIGAGMSRRPRRVTGFPEFIGFGQDEEGPYRYRLWRIWDATRLPVCFAMLNPSTADDVEPDPTVRRCLDFAIRWGAGGLLVVNAFAWRSTDREVLFTLNDPIGPRNIAALTWGALNASMVVAGWGTGGALLSGGDRALHQLTYHADVYALRETKGGFPEHPLYVPKVTVPIRFARRRPRAPRRAWEAT
jgi:hypothetical protein